MDNESRYKQIQEELEELFKDVPLEQMHIANNLIQAYTKDPDKAKKSAHKGTDLKSKKSMITTNSQY
jgi:hypothetical protein